MTEAPPAAPAPRKRFGAIFWIFACCGGCLFSSLLFAGCVGFGIVAPLVRAWDSSADPKLRAEAYDETVRNTGPPPGFKVVRAAKLPWFMASAPVAVLLPEESVPVADTLYDLREALALAPIAAILFKVPDTEQQRAEREKLFIEGKIPDSPGFIRVFIDEEAQHSLENVRTGTIPGHRFPLRYMEYLKRMRTPRGKAEMEVAWIDLTPPEMTTHAVLVVVNARRAGLLTPEFLETFCSNFKPGD